jgi:hypothetical protein
MDGKWVIPFLTGRQQHEEKVQRKLSRTITEYILVDLLQCTSEGSYPTYGAKPTLRYISSETTTLPSTNFVETGD